MNIVLAGFGQEGKASYDYWNNNGNTITIADERDEVEGLPENVPTIFGADAFSKLDKFDVIIRSPGVNPKKLPYGDKVWSATNEFFEKCPAPIIGVTGTKGKGTTSSFIDSILKAAGKTTHLVGNIGVPALAELPNITASDIVVYELSSFQLWDAKKSPHVAVVLMIEPDHLDVHENMSDYIAAKANIVRYQSADDIVVYNETNRYAAGIGASSAAVKYTFPVAIDEVQESLNLPGAHNYENASAAVIVARRFYVNDDQIRAGLTSFMGLPHRLKFIAEKNGVKYYDDSIATTPGSAIAAIRSFDEPKLLILGGHDKGGDYSELFKDCQDLEVSVLAIGANRERLAELCAEYGVECSIEPGDMELIVRRASMEAKKGSVVLLSPAAASFDMFKSYADRGDQFIAAVNNL